MSPRILSIFIVSSVVGLLISCSSTDRGYRADSGPIRPRGPARTESPPPLPPELEDENGDLSLSRLMGLALEKSPRLLASRDLRVARRERRAQVTALPDPVLKLGWYAEEVQTRTGPQSFVIGLNQRIPWPTKLAVAGEIADIEARMAAVESWIAERDVLLELARRYHELAHLEASIELTREIEALWNDLVTRSAALPWMAQSERVRAETRAAQARYDRQVLGELAEIERAAIRSLTALPRELPLPRARVMTPPEIRLDLEQLEDLAVKSNQELLLAELSIEKSRARIEAAELEMFPDFSVGGRYIATDRRPDGVDPSGNGNDPLFFELGITLPLQRSAKRARISERRHESSARVHARHELRLSLRRRLAEQNLRARNEVRLVDLHATVLVPQAEHAAREAEARIAAGDTGLAGLFETIAARHQVQLTELRAKTDYAKRVTQIEALVGHPLQSTTKEDSR